AHPLHDDDVGPVKGSLVALFGGVALLLLIGCVNVASLLVARAATRASEVGLQLALGANARRIARLQLIEGLLLTMAGLAGGLLTASLGLTALVAMAPPSLRRLESSRIDAVVLVFLLAVSMVVGIVFSIAPYGELFKRAALGYGLTPRRTSTAPVLRRQIRAALVLVQVALSVVLLVSAGLLTRAFVQVLRVDPGFRTAQQLTFRIGVPGRYESPAAFNAFESDLQGRLGALAGVTAVGAMSHLPYDDMPNWSLLYSAETPMPSDARQADARAVSSGLFEAMGVPLVEGRPFTEHDDNPLNPVAIVDDRLARE